MECIVEFDYDAEQNDEISLRANDIIKNVKKQPGDGWWEGEINGKRGLFPNNFVKERKEKAPPPPPVISDRPKFEKKSSGGGSQVAELASKIQGIKMGPPPVHQKGFRREGSSKRARQRVRVTYEYKAEKEDELSIKVGDIVDVLKQEEEGWWEGELNGQKGVFPSNFAEPIQEGMTSEEEKEDTEEKEIKGKKVMGVGLGDIFGNQGPIKLRPTAKHPEPPPVVKEERKLPAKAPLPTPSDFPAPTKETIFHLQSYITPIERRFKQMLRTPSTSDEHKNIIDGIAFSKGKIYTRTNPFTERTVLEKSFAEESEYLNEPMISDRFTYFRGLLNHNRLPISIIRLAMKYNLNAFDFTKEIGYDKLAKRAECIGYTSKFCSDFRERSKTKTAINRVSSAQQTDFSLSIDIANSPILQKRILKSVVANLDMNKLIAARSSAAAIADRLLDRASKDSTVISTLSDKKELIAENRKSEDILQMYVDDFSPVRKDYLAEPLVENAQREKGKALREKAVVEHGYKANNEDELTIEIGEVLTIVDKNTEDEGWWKGELNGRCGMFPNNFVKLIPPGEGSNNNTQEKPKKPPPPTTNKVTVVKTGMVPSGPSAAPRPVSVIEAVKPGPLKKQPPPPVSKSQSLDHTDQKPLELPSKLPTPPTFEPQQRAHVNSSGNTDSNLSNAQLDELRKEIQFLRKNTVFKQDFENVQQELQSTKVEMQTMKAEFNKKLLDLMNEIDDEKKKHLSTLVEIDRVKKLVSSK
ncbi:DgyrCDS1826 [Dimorphilus gyrociliatus]|uniref:DgyrCDS1826 n=1 Tax=Dimorphilus gyrociliatus TaxID=2664684 RepID=A0A7I8V8Q8_9ANNE|nr:DgyrCDS1826 [Dimorphilus gyrociliatus]